VSQAELILTDAVIANLESHLKTAFPLSLFRLISWFCVLRPRQFKTLVTTHIAHSLGLSVVSTILLEHGYYL